MDPIPTRHPLSELRPLIKSKWAPLETAWPLRPPYDGAPCVLHSSRQILAMATFGESPEPSLGFFRQRGGASRQMASLVILTEGR